MDQAIRALLAAEPAGGSITDEVLRILVALGISGVLTASLTAWFSRRKTSAEAKNSSADAEGKLAEASATLTGSALSLLAPQQAQIARQEVQIERQDAQLEEQRQQIRELAERIDRLEVDREHSRRRETDLSDQLADTRTELSDCRTWMQLAYALIIQAGIEIDPPPGTRRPPRPRSPS